MQVRLLGTLLFDLIVIFPNFSQRTLGRCQGHRGGRHGSVRRGKEEARVRDAAQAYLRERWQQRWQQRDQHRGPAGQGREQQGRSPQAPRDRQSGSPGYLLQLPEARALCEELHRAQEDQGGRLKTHEADQIVILSINYILFFLNQFDLVFSLLSDRNKSL